MKKDKLFKTIKGKLNYVHQIPTEVNQGTALLFIENPLSGQGLWELFSTHPSTEKRIERLKQLTRKMGRIGV